MGSAQWGPLEPASRVARLCERSEEQRRKWWRTGLSAIADGQLAVLLLAGGQVGASKEERARKLRSDGLYLWCARRARLMVLQPRW